MNEHLRQTGRTSRMISQAVALMCQGREVVILAHHEVFARDLRQRVDAALVAGGARSIKVQVMPERFNWRTMRVEGANPNSVFLVDHMAIEIQVEDIDKQILRLQQLARQLYPLTT